MVDTYENSKIILIIGKMAFEDVQQVALHEVRFANDAPGGELQTVASYSGEDFDQLALRQMKYGDRAITRSFAHQLASLAIDARPSLIEDERPPRLVVPYQHAPPSPFYLAQYALEGVINVEREQRALPAGSVLRIGKSRTQTTNYAVMDFRQRRIECDAIDYYLAPEEDPDEANQIVFFDDVLMTGTVMRHLVDVFKDRDPSDMLMAFIVMFDREQALNYPQIENELYGTASTSVESLIPNIMAGNFDLNVRTLKLILSTPKSMLLSFLASCPAVLREQMLDMTQASGEDFIRYHHLGFQCLRLLNKGGEYVSLQPLTLAHKQNGVEAVGYAFDHGARGVEVDIQSDNGRIIAVHDYLHGRADRYDDLEDILSRHAHRGKIQLDIKAIDLTIVPILQDILTRYITADIELSTNVHPILPALRQAFPAHKLGVIFTQNEFPGWMNESFICNKVLGYMDITGGDIAHIPYDIILSNPGVVRACHAKGIKVQSHIDPRTKSALGRTLDKLEAHGVTLRMMWRRAVIGIYDELTAIGVDQCTVPDIRLMQKLGHWEDLTERYDVWRNLD